MAGKLKILFVEDVIADAELIYREIERNKISFSKLLVDNKEDFLTSLKTFEPDLIISDYSLPRFDGMMALKMRNEQTPLIPFILVTGSVNEEVAVECMKAGADDYILKDNLSRLGPAVVNSIIKSKLAKEKKAADEELYKSELRLQKAQSIAHVGNWELDLSTKTIWGSAEAIRIYGLEKDSHEIPYEIIKKGPLSEYRGMLDEALDRLLKYNEPYEVEFKIKRANDGEIRSIYSKAELEMESDGEQVKVVGVIQDITDPKRAEQALLDSEEKFRSIMENSADAIFITDLQGKYVYTNKAVTDMLGYSSEEMNNLTIMDITPKNETEKYFGIFNQVLIEGKVFTEIELLKKDGSFISTDLNSVLLPGGLVYGSCRDITERKLAQESLKQALEKAEESDRLKTAFLHNISHEIRTPMNAIVGFSALLGEHEVDDQTRKSYIEVIIQSSDHLLSIITDIVDISNIEANLIKTNKNDINLNATIKSICDQFIPRANEKKIKFICETGLSDSEALIITDSIKLIQILSNLVSNAFKFTEKGYIKIWYELKENFLEFCVTDSGIGISPEHHANIFDRFYQVQYTFEKLYEGTGLGLAISKAYVEHLGGKIWLTSEPGKGTSFYFRIPYEKQVAKAGSIDENKAGDNFIFPVKKIILVAEDVESNFKLIRYFLSGSNVEVLHAYNGKEAVEKCLSMGNIDLVLMDIKMPVMDGYTAAKLIRETNSLIPIIAQTAFADDMEKAIECGCSGFISKPFNKKGLLKVISEFI